MPLLVAITVGCGSSDDPGEDEDVSAESVATTAPTATATQTAAILANMATPLPDVPGTWVYWLSDMTFS